MNWQKGLVHLAIGTSIAGGLLLVDSRMFTIANSQRKKLETTKDESITLYKIPQEKTP